MRGRKRLRSRASTTPVHSSPVERNGAVEKVRTSQKSDRCAPHNYPNHLWGQTCLPLSAVLHSRNRLHHLVLVSINRVDECINRADQRVTGRTEPPIELVGQSAI